MIIEANLSALRTLTASYTKLLLRRRTLAGNSDNIKDFIFITNPFSVELVSANVDQR